MELAAYRTTSVRVPSLDGAAERRPQWVLAALRDGSWPL
jgi:hypothetical protein